MADGGGAPEVAGDRRAVLLVTKGLDLGGIERVVVDLAVGLDRRGWPVEVAVVNERRGAFIPLLDDAGITVHRLGGGDHLGARALGRLTRLIRQPRFGIVHVHGPLLAPWIRVAARRGRTAVVTTSHTPWESLHPATRAAWRLTAPLDARAIAVSDAVASSLPGKVRARATVVPHGVDPRVATAATEAAARRGPRTDSVFDAVAVASHRDAKNYPNLLRAVRVAIDRGVDLHLRAIGAGPGLEAHRRLAAELGIDTAVTFEPPMLDVLDAIAAADLVVVASDFEGQPLVVAEALAVGVPVVATAVGRIPELVDASVGVVVPTREPEALGEAIAALAFDDARRTRMSTAATEAAHRWTLDDALDAHEELYRAASEQT